MKFLTFTLPNLYIFHSQITKIPYQITKIRDPGSQEVPTISTLLGYETPI